MKFRSTFLGLCIAAISALSVSCSTLGTTAKNPGAIACPDCRVVIETDSSIEDYSNTATPFLRHECPGCQGRIATLLKEGKLQHRCSICEKSPYSCDVTHPVALGSTDDNANPKNDVSYHTHVFKQR